VENFTNRSPYAMLHLLREDSISEVASDPNELLEIPRRNIETLRGLGRQKILEKLTAIERSVDSVDSMSWPCSTVSRSRTSP
jgi:hypothetical protein